MLSDRDIFMAMVAGFIAIILLAIVAIYFRKKHIKKSNEQMRAKAGLGEA